MQLSPSLDLSGFIKHFLFLDITDASTKKLRLFSDGNPGIVLNSHLILDGKPLPEAFLYGQITEYKEVYCQGPAQLAVIVLHAQGLSGLTNMPAGELSNKVISLVDLFGSKGLTLKREDKWSDKVNQLEDFIRKIANSHRPAGDPLVETALDCIYRHKGVIPIQDLAGRVGCQPRQLERKFGTAVGISPKHLCNILRVHAFIKLLQRDSKPNLTGYAYESGYYDQAHLIREFRKITGLTPSQYLKHSMPLAANFLQL